MLAPSATAEVVGGVAAAACASWDGNGEPQPTEDGCVPAARARLELGCNFLARKRPRSGDGWAASHAKAAGAASAAGGTCSVTCGESDVEADAVSAAASGRKGPQRRRR